MTLRRIVSTILFATLVAIFATMAQPVLAQTSDPSAQKETKDDETNLDTQLYLLIATNQDVDDAKLPSSLAPVVAQLRASLPFKNYRLAATLINRVKNDGRLSLQWVAGPLLPSAAASTLTPSFNEFKVNNVKLITEVSGRDVVRMDGFRFGARIPIQTGTAVASNGPASSHHQLRKHRTQHRHQHARRGAGGGWNLECWSLGRCDHSGDVGPAQLEAIGKLRQLPKL